MMRLMLHMGLRLLMVMTMVAMMTMTNITTVVRKLESPKGKPQETIGHKINNSEMQRKA